MPPSAWAGSDAEPGKAVAASRGPERRAARTMARKKYVSCIKTAVAKDAKGVRFDEYLAFAKCRHTYFKNWTDFQANALLAGSTCIGIRFTDGCTLEFVAPQAVVIEPGHIGWVVGDEDAVLIEVDFEGETARRFGLPEEHRHR